jgi:HPt (histidine-containing phosphotransfer) domain-containing protein
MPEMPAKTIDLPTFRALQDSAGADFVKELVDTFLEDAPVMLGDLKSALAARDADRFRRAAHSLKSNSNTFGALVLGTLARVIEVNGLERALESPSDPLARVVQEYARVAETLKALRDA